MQFQFTEVSNIQEQIEALTKQLAQLTESIAPYSECEAVASELVTKVAEHRQLMESKGLAPNSLYSWGLALFEAGCNQKIEINLEQQLEVAALKSAVDEYRVQIENSAEVRRALLVEKEELAKKVEFFKSDLRETDSFSKEVAQLRKENEEYQARYEGIKAQEGAWERDYRAVKSNYDKALSDLVLLTKSHNELLDKLNVRQDTDVISHLEEMLEAANQQIKERDEDIKALEARLDGAVDEEVIAITGADVVVMNDARLGIMTIIADTTEAIVNEQAPQVGYYEILKVNDICQVPTGECGTVVSFTNDAITIKLPDGQVIGYKRSDLKYIASQPELDIAAVTPTAPAPYIDKIATLLDLAKKNTGQIVWEDIAVACDNKAIQFDRLVGETTTARSAIIKVLGDAIPHLLAEYVLRTEDESHYAWVGKATELTAKRLVKETLDSLKKEQGATLTQTQTEAIKEPKLTAEEKKDKLDIFIGKLHKSSVAWNNLTWEKVRDVFNKDRDMFRVLITSGLTKGQKEKAVALQTRIPELLADYIQRTNDKSDIDWVISPVKNTVEGLLAEKKSELTAYPIGADVSYEDDIYKVVSFDGAWVVIKNSDNLQKKVLTEEISLLEPEQLELQAA